ncbi:13216_t:CDS:2, partial [Gigaspora margarita]
SRNSSNSKPGRPQTGVWKFFTRGQSKGNSHWKGTCNYCGTFCPHAKPQNLQAHLANFFNNLENIPTDEPFSIFLFTLSNNPFFKNALNLLNPSYSIPSHKVFSGCLLDIEVAKVISKVDKILEYTNNLSIGLDEYLYKLENFSDQLHIAEFLANQIKLIINQI